MIRRVTGMAMALLLLLTAGSAAAQSQDPRIDEARTHFEQGEDHYEGGRYGLAAQDFQAAFDLLSEAGHTRALMVLFNLGRTLERMPGRESEARTAYQRVIDESPRTAEFENTRQMATDGLRELDARRGSDDGGSSGGGTISAIGPIILGVGGAALLAGVIVAGVSLGMDADFRGACDDLTMCPTTLRPQYDEMRAFSTAADVLMVAGGGIAILGLVLTLTLTEGQANATATVACTADSCLALARGSF